MGDHTADDIGMAADQPEHPQVCGEKDGPQRHLGGPGDGGQAVDEVGGQLGAQRHRVPGVWSGQVARAAGHGGAGGVGQCVAPEPRGFGRVAQGQLFGDEVPVGQWQRGDRFGGTGEVGGVAGEQFGGERRDAPAVQDRVVEAECQGETTGGQGVREDAQQWRGRQVEAVPAFGVPRIADHQWHGDVRMHDLDRFGELGEVEGRAEDGVPSGQLGECRRERLGPQVGAFDVQREHVVVGRGGLGELAVEQHAGLQRGQRVGVLGAVADPGLLGDRRADQRERHDRLGLVDGRRQGGRQAAQGGPAEHVGQFGPVACRAEPCDDLQRADRVAAQCEEVVQRTDPLDAQHAGPHRGDGLFGRAGGFVERPCVVHSRRCGQRGTVQLAVRGDRQFGQWQIRGGQHVCRQDGGQPGGQIVRYGRHHVRDQVGRAVLARCRHDGRRTDLRLGEQRGLDLAGFDPHAADLDLVVQAAEIGQFPGRQPAAQIAGAVQPAAGRAERVGHEPGRGERGPAGIAVGQLHAGKAQFARHADRGGAAVFVQHVHLRVRHRGTDREHGLAGPAAVGGHVDRGLGGSVQVDQFGVREGGVAAVGQRRGECLAGADDGPQGRQCGRVRLVEERGQHRRYEVDGVDSLLGKECGEVVGVAVAAGCREDRRGGLDERPAQLPHRHVEPDGRLVQDAVAGTDRQHVLHPAQPVGQCPV